MIRIREVMLAIVCVALLTSCSVSFGWVDDSRGDSPNRTMSLCSGEQVLSPPGSHYCFPLPSGFTDASNNLTIDNHAGSKPIHRTAVAIGRRDLIYIAEYALAFDADTMSTAELVEILGPVLAESEAQGVSITTPTPQEDRIDGALALG